MKLMENGLYQILTVPESGNPDGKMTAYQNDNLNYMEIGYL
jgi:hypothetical protein